MFLGEFTYSIDEKKRLAIPAKFRQALGKKAVIAVSKEYFAGLEKDMRRELAKAESKIFELAESVFNVGSPKQLSAVLFEKLMLSPKGMHKTPCGIVSTASPELEKIKSLHPIVQEVLNYRELAKLLHT